VSALVVGVSHRSAPIALLERLAVDPDGAAKLIEDVLANQHVSEATVVATCNRLEVYAAVDRFHGSVEDLSQRILQPAADSVEALLPHLYVHYDDGAVSHLFRVAAGLDSMAVGEAQILGQTRDALRLGQEHGSIGPVLNTLFQQALRVGKRVHAETDIDKAAPSLVHSALDRAGRHLDRIAGRTAVVV
jgi:glutamyl-tRNA reductase